MLKGIPGHSSIYSYTCAVSPHYLFLPYEGSDSVHKKRVREKSKIPLRNAESPFLSSEYLTSTLL